jgi:hypothetical protein
VLLAALAVAGVTTACGQSSDALPPTSDPVAWAGRLCSSLQPLAALKGNVPNFDRNNPAESREAMSNYFGQAVTAADRSIQGLEQTGPSPVPGGDDVASRLHNGLGQLRTAYKHAQAKVESVDPTDPVGMGTQLPAILTELESATTSASLGSIGNNPALNDAVRKAPSCALVGAAGNQGK